MKKGWYYDVIVGLLVLCTAIILYLMGRNLICPCGDIKLWFGGTISMENSQHITDFYTFSHIIHGFGFFGLLWFFRKKLSLGVRCVLAFLLESVWEIIENTPAIINYYRQSTISSKYNGDSVINSISDILAMLLGFWLAARLPLKVTISLIITELLVGYLIRDNLNLNILMFIYPSDTVKSWQMGS